MNVRAVFGHRVFHAIAGVVVIALLAAAAWYGYESVVSHPVQRVVFAGATERLPAAELDALARSIQGAARPSLASVREAARRIAWVRDASVRRLSVDTLEVQFEAHEPLARWNDDALVSRRGEVFRADYDAALPRFRGAEESAPAVAREYAVLAKTAEPLASPIAELRFTARGAWQATLESGLVIELGRNDIEARLARFASAWPALQARNIATKHADLRYPNGFALRRSDPTPKETPRKKA